MKTISHLLLLLNMTFSFRSVANDDKYEQAMKKNIEQVYQAESVDKLLEVVNSFDRIASAEKIKWEPFYYSAFGYILAATREEDKGKKDEYLDLAFVAIEKAKELSPEESEIVALEGFGYMIRVTVDPGSRGPQFAGLAMQSFGKASVLNPENPRALVLSAQMQYGTAQFFGSSTTEACGILDLALEKFETYKSENKLAPQWGKPMAENLKKQCK